MSVVRGESVAPGIAVGQVHLRGFESKGAGPRIAADEVEAELNRLHAAFEKSRAQTEEIKEKHKEVEGICAPIVSKYYGATLNLYRRCMSSKSARPFSSLPSSG